MRVFNFFKKSKTNHLTDEQRKWNRMWDLWVEGRVGSPYTELMTYQSEINNGGHDQYFINLENSNKLQANITVLETVLPEELQANLRKAYSAYLQLKNGKSDMQSEEVMSQCDDDFYKDEEEVNCMLRAYATEIEL